MVLGEDSTPYYYRKYLWKHLSPKIKAEFIPVPNSLKIDWSYTSLEKSKLDRRIKEVLKK